MTAPTVTITAFLGVDATSSVFILDDPVRGLLDGATYVLGGDLGIDITDYFRVTSIERGRERAIDQMNVGVAHLVADNRTRTFDPEFVAGAYYGMIKPGVQVTIAADGVTIFDGLVDDWDFDYFVSGDSTASFDVVDCLATLGSSEFDAWTTTAGQTPGQRLASILDRPEVQFPSTRDLDIGTSILQADNVSWGSNVLNYAQLVAKCDLGQLFASRDGTLTFYGRNRTVTGTGALLFADDGTGIPFSNIVRQSGTELLFNRVSVDAIGFTKQTVTNQDSIDEFRKVWSLSLPQLPLNSEVQALDLAGYLLGLYSEPDSRIATITVPLHRLEAADRVAVLSLDIGSVVRVIYTPNDQPPPIDKFCMVEGVSHGMAPKEHTVTLKLSNLADGFGTTPFILDDAFWGILDTAGHGLLAF